MKSILAILTALWCLTGAAAPTNFVLLVECSPRMSVRKEAVIDIAREFISTGVDERVRPGQNFEVWFYDETLQADAVKMSWTPATAAAYAKLAAERIAAKRFNIQSDIAKALPSIQMLVKNSGEATVFILLDGFQPLSGTPFDEQINKEMSENRDAFFAAKEPFLITLRGREGKWLVGNVHSKLGATIDVPEFPKPPEPEKIVEPVKIAQAAPPPQPVVETPPPKRVEPEPVVERKPEPIIEKTLPQPVVERPAPVVDVVESKVQPAARTEERPLPVAPTTVPDSQTTGRIIDDRMAPVTSAHMATTPAPSTPKFPWPILLAIFGLIAAGGIYAYVRMKEAPPKPQASLISQAYDSNPDETIPRLPGSPGMRLKIRLPTPNPPVEHERPKRDQ